MPKTSEPPLAASPPSPLSQRSAAVLWAALVIFILYGSINRAGADGEVAVALPGISMPDITQNVLLYIPFGTLAALGLRRTNRPVIAVRLTAIAWAAVFSALIEYLQLFSASRIASALDVGANVAGAAIGVAIAGVVDRFITKSVTRLRPTGLFDTRARFALLLITAVLCAVAWAPFDITLDVSTLSQRTRLVRDDPWLQPGRLELAAHAVSYFVHAVTVTACLPGLGRRAPFAALMMTLAVAIVIDAGQLAMGSRPIGLAALLSQAAGAGVGAAAMFIAAVAGRPRYADA